MFLRRRWRGFGVTGRMRSEEGHPAAPRVVALEIGLLDWLIVILPLS
jgi:hypothetical protein